MKFTITLVFTLLASSVIASEIDQTLSDNIIGTWWSRTSNGNMAVESAEAFSKDGVLVTKGDVYVNGQLVEQYKIKSNWKINDSHSLVEITESSNPSIVPVGLTIKDKIISITEKEFVYLASDGTQHTLTRIK